MMAQYEYLCKDCSFVFIYECSMENRPGDEGALVCTDCLSANVRRVYSPPGIAFKSPGFYSVDNRKKKQ